MNITYYIHTMFMQAQCDVFTFTYLVATIGFSRATHSVSEGAGSVNVTISVQTGTLGRDVIVSLSSVNGTAIRESLKPL